MSPTARPSQPPPAFSAPTPSAPPSDHFNASLRAHARESRDPSWASTTEGSLRAVLVSGATSAYEVESIDCRATLCVARIRWPSRVTAAREYTRYAGRRYTPNCGVEIFLPAATDDDKPYSMPMVFHCAEARDGGAEWPSSQGSD